MGSGGPNSGCQASAVNGFNYLLGPEIIFLNSDKKKKLGKAVVCKHTWGILG